MANRILSGIQPTGNLHLGNYLGAIVNWVKMQHEMETFICVVDLHAITVPQNPADLRTNTLEMAAAILASGIDPQQAVLFNQSAVPEHAQLAWVLNCTARLGWLNRMTQFKEKSGKDREGASVGLYAYPVLQAADILIYKATHVPVGEDQKQHLELARDIAQKFNTDFSVELFPLPEPVIQGPATRVMSLRDGTKKMSKSEPSDMSRINLTDTAEIIADKIRKAKTDPDVLQADPANLKTRPEAENLVGIYAALSGESVPAVLAQFDGKGFGSFKPALAELVVSKLAPVTAEFRRLKDDTSHVESVLRQGADNARRVTRSTLAEVYQAVGFLQFPVV
jgi:tryptophanyl-tRNA synthetase